MILIHLSAVIPKIAYRKLLLSLGLGIAYFCFSYQELTALEPNSQKITVSRKLETVTVVGTQIDGSKVSEVLPVTIINKEYINVTGAASGDELLRSIPQTGDILFNESEFTGVNGARGDVGSINLRGIGTGNTLVLLNGRRLVNHPGTQYQIHSVNTQSLPTTGINRIEILKDGASAIYGTDAVAGVINVVTLDDYEGYDVSLRYGSSDSTDLAELSGTLKYGINFNNERTNFSVFANFLTRQGFSALQKHYSATEDLRVYFVGTPFEGLADLNNTSTNTQWAEFTSLDGEIDEIQATSFHIQPDTMNGCKYDLPNGVCVRDGASIDYSLRLDRARYRDLVGDVNRQNVILFLNHQFENSSRFFGEFTFYSADYNRQRETAQILSSGRMGVPANSYYNPFNKRLRLNDYRALDVGLRMINVKNESYRLLGGLRFEWNNWNFETAVLRSEAKTVDSTHRMSNTLFQRAFSRTTSDAYNLFAGGNTSDIHAPNTFNSSNSQATINSFIVPVFRIGKTTLTLWDIKLSDSDFRKLPAGDLGLALGLEFRTEEFTDDRDPRLDGTIKFTDTVISGNVNQSDVVGTSPTPDTFGDRHVTSAFAELAIPLINEKMYIKLAHRAEAQIAIRAENYSDVGSVIKPKIALSWDPSPRLKFRTALSQGFRSPNLEQINVSSIRRVTPRRVDWIHCAATSAANRTDFNKQDCDGNTVEFVRSGGKELKPEENTNLSVGMIYRPPIRAELVMTVDWWRVEQEKVVGNFGDQNQITLDYVLRINGGSNPNVVRENPTPEQTTLFNRTSFSPAGYIKEVLDPYTNLTPRQFEGVDLGIEWNLDTEAHGNINAVFNAAYLQRANQDHSHYANIILSAISDGRVDEAVTVGRSGNLVKQDGRPQWRSNANLIWKKDPWLAGIFFSYTGEVIDTSVIGRQNQKFVVDAFQTYSVFVQYNVDSWKGGDTQIRVGIRNIFDQDPPIADEQSSGYFPSLHSNRGQNMYFEVKRNF